MTAMGGEGIDQERQCALAELQIRRRPSCQVVGDEHEDAGVLDSLEDGAGFLETQGKEAGDNEHGHDVPAPHRRSPITIQQRVETFPHL